ncbi:MAG: toxin-antitoxin system HicB family antitoxin [Chitinispirillaceae bacterium]|nr:toxin-antitoxin system HicB family antitoxin [Chitinispirillaceae bacterium]
MSTISLRLPDSLHKAAREEARKDNISINQLVMTALAEKISSLKTIDYLAARAAEAPSRRQFLKLMDKVPDVKPDTHDRLR